VDIGSVATIAVLTAVMAVMLEWSSRGAGTLAGLFHPPELGWPQGVQEDDDVRWNWRAAGLPTPRPVIEPLRRARVDVEPLHPRLALRAR
jgi:hypothetical protein